MRRKPLKSTALSKASGSAYGVSFGAIPFARAGTILFPDVFQMMMEDHSIGFSEQ
jgi:hypothetical protein